MLFALFVSTKVSCFKETMSLRSNFANDDPAILWQWFHNTNERPADAGLFAVFCIGCHLLKGNREKTLISCTKDRKREIALYKRK
jgi:hypothetical protein